MKKRIVLACLSMVSGGLVAREIRTPLNLQQGVNGHLHAPLELEEEDLGHSFNYDVWGGAYAQSAHDAYDNCHHKVNIAKIFFGKESFRGREVFFNSTVTDPTNPAATFMNFAVLTPSVEYNENGAVFGASAMYSLNEDSCRVGIRANLPYKVVEMHNDDASCGCGLGEVTLEDVCVRQSDLFVADTDPRVTLDSTVDNDWACRLDFLSSLCSASCTVPLVRYGTGTGAPTRMHGKDVTDTGNLSPDLSFTTGNPIHLIQVPVGSVPTGLLAAVWNPTVSTLPFLSGAGAGPGDGNRTRFDDGTDYTPLSLDQDAQSKFWVVPTLVTLNASNELVPTDDSNEIRNMIDQLTNQSNMSAVDFFLSNGFSFATQKTRGIGDFDTQLFFGYFVDRALYTELEFGVRFPTGKKIKHPNLIYKMATGNNGHYELEVGGMAWWKGIDCIVLKADASYHWVLSARERVAAAFKGATVKNINPILDAKISWRYLIAHVDLTFLHPENPGLGFDVGYEFYWKTKDDICFRDKNCSDDCHDDDIMFSTVNGSNATDLFGVSEPLSSCVLERATKRIAHKLRIEFFHHWNFGDLYAGWSQVFHGKNIMRETSYYLGMSINF